MTVRAIAEALIAGKAIRKQVIDLQTAILAGLRLDGAMVGEGAPAPSNPSIFSLNL
jgi:hypothetical protein